MHVPLLRALDPYARGHAVARWGVASKDPAKAAEFEALVVGSVLDKPKGGSRFRESVQGEDEEEASGDIPAFERLLAVDYAAPGAEDDDALLPEDAHDAQDLCAMLETAAHSRF